MIKINFGKKYWTIDGHAPLYICYCISRMTNLLSIEQNYFSKSNKYGFTKVRNTKTSLAKNIKFLFENMAINHSKHIKIENANNFANIVLNKIKEKL